MLSPLDWPKVITLSGFYCIRAELRIDFTFILQNYRSSLNGSASLPDSDSCTSSRRILRSGFEQSSGNRPTNGYTICTSTEASLKVTSKLPTSAHYISAVIFVKFVFTNYSPEISAAKVIINKNGPEQLFVITEFDCIKIFYIKLISGVAGGDVFSTPLGGDGPLALALRGNPR